MFKRAARYQNGSLTIEKRNAGPPVWVFRWREPTSQGSINRKRVIGSRTQYPTKREAMKAVQGLRLDINADAVICHNRTLTVSDLGNTTKRGRSRASGSHHLPRAPIEHS